MIKDDDTIHMRGRRERVAKVAGRIGRDAHERGGDVAARAVDFARDNPFPTALAGLGLGLLAVAVLGGGSLRGRALEAGATAGGSVQDRPLILGAAAFGLGTAFGYALPRIQVDIRDRWTRGAEDDMAVDADEDLKGEGDYEAARRYREATEAFAEDDNPAARARAAAAERSETPQVFRRAEAAGRRPTQASSPNSQKPNKIGG